MTTAKKHTRAEAYETLQKYVTRESLLRHSLAVEAAMRQFATRFGENAEMWGIIGLLHDLDFEKYPDQHCHKTPLILEEEGYPSEWGRYIVSHGWKICADVPPEHIMEKALYTVDQLTGLITATALVRPSKSLNDLTVKSVKKKWKDKAFATNVDREVIMRGVDLLQMELADVIDETINGLKPIATELGLNA